MADEPKDLSRRCRCGALSLWDVNDAIARMRREAPGCVFTDKYIWEVCGTCGICGDCLLGPGRQAAPGGVDWSNDPADAEDDAEPFK